MKKLFLFSLAFLAILSCSSEDDGGNVTDPIIGTWNTSGSFDDFIDEEETIPATINFESTFTSSADGTGSRNLTISTNALGDEISNYDETYSYTWENTASNPDFNSTDQIYRITVTSDEGENSFLDYCTFSSNFMTVTSTTEDGVVIEWTKE
tara:strand:- start:964 stop:1419 length:456 start_codon:yes stop_codon:yes gene_type:complete